VCQRQDLVNTLLILFWSRQCLVVSWLPKRLLDSVSKQNISFALENIQWDFKVLCHQIYYIFGHSLPHVVIIIYGSWGLNTSLTMYSPRLFPCDKNNCCVWWWHWFVLIYLCGRRKYGHLYAEGTR
jgi:hypothetical protein